MAQDFAHPGDERLKQSGVPGAGEQENTKVFDSGAMLLQFIQGDKGHWHMAQPADGTARQLSGSKCRI
jgi:hypothetical protein